MVEKSARKIGIIGTGNIGGTLTRRLTTLGYEGKRLANHVSTASHGT
jgi:predicted dinucleotide-binding enzyme